MVWKGRHKWIVKTRRLRAPRQRPVLPPLPEGDFPVYPLLWHPCRTHRSLETDPDGRVIGIEYCYDYQPSEPQFQEMVGPNDVVWIPLYKGTLEMAPSGEDVPRMEFEQNLQAIEDLAPKVRAILVGNANAEIHYEVPRDQAWERAIEFIEKHSALIRPYGRPAFAPVFEILMHDCYMGGGKLRDLINANDALVLSFNGCGWLFEKKYPKIPELHPYPQLVEYLKTMPVWSGVGLQRGLDAGSDRVLKMMGISAGFMGTF